MEQKKQGRTGAMGILPSAAPLANAYVPFQTEQPVQYEIQKGIIRGTLYPGLDLPFMGITNKKLLPKSMLSELQMLDFAIQELALYLDTHREDQEALELYRQYQKQYKILENDYMKKHGPLNHKEISARSEYEWLSDPWPWEYCSNGEG